MAERLNMKKFLSKFGNSKMWCGLLMVLSLGLLILLVMEKSNTPGIPNESKKVKADYREEVRFSRDTWVEFPDFDLLYLGTGVNTGGGMHVPIKSSYFKIVKGGEENIIFWTAGTGDIGPIPFEFNDNDYMIEMELMSFDRKREVKLGKNQLSISRTGKAATPTNTPLPATATPEPTHTPTPIPTDTPTSPLCNSVRLFDLPSVSPSGKYSLEVTPGTYDANPASPTKIIVRQTANPDQISEIYPLDNRNVPPSFQVGFTANDNILASWGCGTACSAGILYAPDGQMLKNDFGFFEISPSRNMAIDFPVPAGETPVSGDIRIIDLNTGQTLKTEHHSIIDSPCCVTWGDLSVTLHYSCKNQTSEDLTIMLPNR